MILWDEGKNEWLQRERGISFDQVAELILGGRYVAIVQHKQRASQKIFLVPIRGYIHAVPFIIDDDGNLVLKTIFPSRKFNKVYGGASNEGKT